MARSQLQRFALGALALGAALLLTACAGSAQLTLGKGVSAIEVGVDSVALALDTAEKSGQLKGQPAADAEAILADLSAAADLAETAYHADSPTALAGALAQLSTDIGKMTDLAPKAAASLQAALSALQVAVAAFAAAQGVAPAPASPSSP